MPITDSKASDAMAAGGPDGSHDWTPAANFVERVAYREGVRILARAGRLVMRPASSELSAGSAAELAAMAPRILEFLEAADAFDEQSIPEPPDSRRLRLSRGQLQMYRTMLVDGLTSNFHISNVMRIEGRIELARLCASVEATVSAHHALLARFPSDPTAHEGVVQLVDPATPVHCRALDWRALENAERDARLAELISDNRGAPFDLAEGPLFRLDAVWTEESVCYLLMTFHHLVLDDWSMVLLHREIAQRYADGKAPAWSGRAGDYGRFVDWQAQWLKSAAAARRLAYWEQRLGDLEPVVELPFDRPRTARIDNRSASLLVSVDAAVAGRLRALASQSRMTLFPLLFAAFCILLWRLSLRRKIPVATLVANRETEAFENTIGLFFNTVVLTVDVDPEQPFSAFAADVNDAILAGLENGAAPFLELVNRLCRIRDPALAPLAQVLFTFVNDPHQRADTGGISIEKGGGGLDVGSAYDMRITGYEAGDAINLVMQYRVCLCDEATAQCWAAAYRQLLASIASGPELPLKELRLQADRSNAADAVASNPAILDEWEQPLPAGFVGLLHAPEDSDGPDRPAAAAPRTWARRLPGGGVETYDDAAAVLQVDGRPADLTQVREALCAYPGVRDAAFAVEATHLVAYVVIEQGATVPLTPLKRHLFAWLPSYAVPTSVRRVPRIPRRVGGTVDTAALAGISSTLPELGRDSLVKDERLAPLRQIWSSTLRLTDISDDDDFFAVGGNSLTGALIVAAVNRRFKCRSTLRQLFEARILARHGEAIDALVREREAEKESNDAKR